MCIAVQSHIKIPRVQNFQFSSFLPEKKYMFYINVGGVAITYAKEKNLKFRIVQKLKWRTYGLRLPIILVIDLS